jgi:hypothetical protein
MPPILFALIILEIGSWFVSYFTLPTVARMTDMYHHAQLFSFSVEMGLINYFPGLAWNHNPPDLHLLSS